MKQLTSETGQFSNKFENDSIYNRISHNETLLKLDNLNQLLQNEKDYYCYDTNGRRLSKNDARYSYDALGRLVKYSQDNLTTLYTYDPLGRRIRQSTPESTQEYIYQFDTEMGSTSKHKKEFRLLHKNATLAIELEDQVYAPIRNQRGDICQLLNPHATTTIRYDAFGNFMHEGLLPPWLFSGQRYDPTTQLYHFHKRDFDSSIGRWLTPDPLHFVDGPNLYTYVHNNSLTYVDPYGLWTEEARNCIHAFSRGALDDATWNVSTLAVGEFKPTTRYEQWAYYGGTGGSVVAGFFYGGTLAKLCVKACAKTATICVQKTSNIAFKQGIAKETARTKGMISDKGSQHVKKPNSSSQKNSRGKKRCREENFIGTPNELSNHPDWKEITHPRQLEAGHRVFENKKTGEFVRFNRGRPNEPGHRRYYHYHRWDQNTPKGKYYDYEGNLQNKKHDTVHLYPPEGINWNF